MRFQVFEKINPVVVEREMFYALWDPENIHERSFKGIYGRVFNILLCGEGGFFCIHFVQVVVGLMVL